MNNYLVGESWRWYEDALNTLAPNTRRGYFPAFTGFLEHAGYTTETLFKTQLENTRSDDPRAKKQIPRQVNQYTKHLMQNEGKKSGSAKIVEKAVNLFFSANEVPFTMGRYAVKVESEEIPSITKAQQRQILNATGNFKATAYLLIAKDGGLRTSDIAGLPIGILEKAHRCEGVDGREYVTFEWKQRKTGRIANPVLGPEALKAIDDWMRYRREILGIPAGDTDPLFCIERIRDGYTSSNGRETRPTVKGGWMNASNMGVIFGQLTTKAGIEADPLTGRRPSIHSLRKFHKTCLEYAGCPTSWINKMQGRKGEGTGGRYTRPSPEQLVEVYSRAYSGLELFGEGGQVEPELTELRGRIVELEAERDRYRLSFDARMRRLEQLIEWRREPTS